MDVKDLKVLIKMITETDITEFEMDNSEEKIVIRRGAKTEYVAMPTVSAAVAAVAAPEQSVATSVVLEDGDVISAPIVGTFYCAPEPGAAPYVEVGQVVEKGQMLCIIEAMKLMNEIEADFAGTIVQVMVENGQAVEFGEPLFVIDTAR